MYVTVTHRDSSQREREQSFSFTFTFNVYLIFMLKRINFLFYSFYFFSLELMFLLYATENREKVYKVHTLRYLMYKSIVECGTDNRQLSPERQKKATSKTRITKMELRRIVVCRGAKKERRKKHCNFLSWCIHIYINKSIANLYVIHIHLHMHRHTHSHLNVPTAKSDEVLHILCLSSPGTYIFTSVRTLVFMWFSFSYALQEAFDAI